MAPKVRSAILSVPEAIALLERGTTITDRELRMLLLSCLVHLVNLANKIHHLEAGQPGQ